MELHEDGNALISYAQNFEDIRLYRALKNEQHGIYIDLGAGDSIENSVTKLFYDLGWNGINVEPGPNFLRLARDRVRDINLEVAIADNDGEATFHLAIPYPDLSSLTKASLDADPQNVTSSHSKTVQTTTLGSIVRDYVKDQPVDFLKIDIEGSERTALSSVDFSTFRPLIIVVEAISPGSREPNFEQWESLLTDANYVLAFDDRINRFYTPNDRSDLRSQIAQPISALDGFALWPQEKLQQTLDKQTEKLLQTDRELKKSLVSIQQAHDVNIALIHENTHARVVIAELEDSWSMRIGRKITAIARPVDKVVKPLASKMLASVRRRRSRPEKLVLAQIQFTEPGSPLETIRLKAQGSISPSSPVNTPSTNLAIEELINKRRQSGPRLLNESEWKVILEAAMKDPSDVGLKDLAFLRFAIEAKDPTPRWIVVIDVRPFQLFVESGTTSHAQEVLDAVIESRPEGAILRYLSDPSLPPPSREIRELFDGKFLMDEIDSVGSFLNLSPYLPGAEVVLSALLGSSAISTATIWLDAIPGLSSEVYLDSTGSYLSYQLYLEQVSRADAVISISKASTSEAESIGFDPDRIITAGCKGRFSGSEQISYPLGLPFDRYVVVVGNALPHKNIALGVLGSIGAVRKELDQIGIVVLGNVSQPQEQALQEMAKAVGFSNQQLVVKRQTPRADFVWLVGSAEAVIVPSLHEGFSLPVIEAIRLQTPVVLSDIPAHREILSSPRWMFDPDDPASLTSTLTTVLANPVKILKEQQADLDQEILDQRFDRGTAVISEQLWQSPSALFDQQPIERSSGEELRKFSVSKICELEDFAHPRLRQVIQDVFSHERIRFGANFPSGREYRKYWEVAMAILAFRDGGLLDGSHDFLGIGAGNEPTVFYLTRFSRRVLATDLYLTEDWAESASDSMLKDPNSHWPFEWNPDALEVAHMDALNLDLPDASFSGIFSSSSIEHFGDRSDVSKSLDEAFRVLKPGGILSISTEFRLEGPRPGVPGVLMFDRNDITDLFLADREWALMEPFDPSVSAATWATEQLFSTAAADQQSQVDILGGLWTHHIEYADYPHLVLRIGDRVFTSFHLALRKSWGVLGDENGQP